MFKDAFDFYCEAKFATLKRLGGKKEEKDRHKRKQVGENVFKLTL